MIKALIFDLDGTLADTCTSIAEAVNAACDHYGFTRKSYEQVKSALGNGAQKLIAAMIPEEYQNRIGEILDFYNNEYAKVFMKVDKCYDGMKETVEAMKKDGYRMAVLSNKPDRFTKAMVEKLFEDSMPFEIIAGQTEKKRKPSPEVPLEMAEKLGVKPSECAFIGDSDVDVMTARNSGMLSVGVSWGYRGHKALKEIGADIIVDSPAELLKAFGKQ